MSVQLCWIVLYCKGEPNKVAAFSNNGKYPALFTKE